MKTQFAIAAALTALLALPAAAAPFCTPGSSGSQFSFSIGIGKFTEQDRNEFNLMQLRQMGVDATRAETWNGCIRAFVRKPGGGEEMQFFDPDTFVRVQ